MKLNISVDTDLDIPVIEQVILYMTLQKLREHGWRPFSVYDSVEEIKVRGIKGTMEAIAGIDDILIVKLTRDDKTCSWFTYIPGEGAECINDYGLALGNLPTKVACDLNL